MSQATFRVLVSLMGSQVGKKKESQRQAKWTYTITTASKTPGLGPLAP